MMKPLRLCELCNRDASFYCPSDSAYLCHFCDAKVHGANFLVARHMRKSVCYKCKRFSGDSVSGVAGFCYLLKPCRSCFMSGNICNERCFGWCSDSSSVSCGSTAESSITGPKEIRGEKIGFTSSVSEDFIISPEIKVKEKETMRSRASLSSSKNVDRNAEALFRNWCSKLDIHSADSIVGLALQTLGICLDRLSGLPFRLSLAAAFWLSLRLCGGESVYTIPNLKRMEEMCRVPAKLILAAEGKLGRMVKVTSKCGSLEEGWAESSG